MAGFSSIIEGCRNIYCDSPFIPIGNAPWYALSLGITLAKNFSYLISFTV